MVITNLQETENDEIKPKKRRRRNGFFNSMANNLIPQLSPSTTFKLFLINLTSTLKKLKSTSRLLRAYSKSEKEHEKRHSLQIKPNKHPRRIETRVGQKKSFFFQISLY